MAENKSGNCKFTLFSWQHATPLCGGVYARAAAMSAIFRQMHHQNPADAQPELRGIIRIRYTPTESCLHLQRQ